jgi:hypothetical protein
MTLLFIVIVCGRVSLAFARMPYRVISIACIAYAIAEIVWTFLRAF